jgi:hypothetical protein
MKIEGAIFSTSHNLKFHNTMEITTLQQRINERAEAKFQQMMKELVRNIKESPILNTLKMNIGEKQVDLFGYAWNNPIFQINREERYHESEVLPAVSNFLEVKEHIIAQLIQEETDHLLAQIDSINDIIDNQG